MYNAKPRPSLTLRAMPLFAKEQTICICLKTGRCGFLEIGALPKRFPFYRSEPQSSPLLLASGLYAVTITDVNSATNTASIQVTVFASPQISSPDQPALCPGNLFNLSNVTIWEANPAAAGSVSWHSASPANASNVLPGLNVTPVVNTIYYALSTNSNGCSNEMPLEISINALPVADAGPDLFLCPGGSDTLMASGGVSCSWQPVTGLSNPNSCNPIAAPSGTTTIF